MATLSIQSIVLHPIVSIVLRILAITPKNNLQQTQFCSIDSTKLSILSIESIVLVGIAKICNFIDSIGCDTIDSIDSIAIVISIAYKALSILSRVQLRDDISESSIDILNSFRGQLSMVLQHYLELCFVQCFRLMSANINFTCIC